MNYCDSKYFTLDYYHARKTRELSSINAALALNPVSTIETGEEYFIKLFESAYNEIGEASLIPTINTENDTYLNAQFSSVFTDCFIYSILECLRYWTENSVINISKTARYTRSLGFFELLSEEILSYDRDNDNFIYERASNSSIKSKAIAINKENAKKIFTEDEAQLGVLECSLRQSSSKILSTNAFFSCIVEKDEYVKSSYPAYNVAFNYSILSKCRGLSTSINNFLKSNTDAERMKSTKLLYNKYVKLFELFKSFDPSAEPAHRIDTALYNFQLEKYFHLHNIQDILQAYKGVKILVTDIDSPEIEKLLIKLLYLPNAFSRKYILDHVIAILTNKSLTSDMRLKQSKDYICYQLNILYPVMERYTLHNFVDWTSSHNIPTKTSDLFRDCTLDLYDTYFSYEDIISANIFQNASITSNQKCKTLDDCKHSLQLTDAPAERIPLSPSNLEKDDILFLGKIFRTIFDLKSAKDTELIDMYSADEPKPIYPLGYKKLLTLENMKLVPSNQNTPEANKEIIDFNRKQKENYITLLSDLYTL